MNVLTAIPDWGMALIALVTSLLAVLWIHPKVVLIALKKKITDNPNKRKLQKVPVPVLGGCVVFFGLMLGCGVVSLSCMSVDSFVFFTLISVMLYTGMMDDVLGLSPGIRFLIEALVSLALIYYAGYCINDFHGLWGIGAIPAWIAVPLTVVTIVGIINAINLIDGVDGLSSGYCIMSSTVFGIYFLNTGHTEAAVIAAACTGALIPFFIFNVFGHKLKMFIGDGGTLLMGMVLSIFVVTVLDKHNSFNISVDASGRVFGVVPFTLAVMAIPVFDTIRVMTMRVLKGKSPFRPDKTHLHHLFIELGFSHFQTTMCELLLNALIIIGWWLIYRIGASVDIQFYFVIFTGFLFTAVLYWSVRRFMCKRQS